MALDELLDRDIRRSTRAKLGERAVELGIQVHPARARRAGGGARLEDERVPHRRGERADLGRAACRRGLRGRDAGVAQRLLHRRLVPAQVGGPHRRPGDAARLARLRGGHGVCLDRQLEGVDPHLALCEPDRIDERADIGDVADLLVVEHPVLQVRVEIVEGALPDPDDGRARCGKPAHELALIQWKRRLDEDDIHAQIVPGGTGTVPVPPP